MKGAMQHLCVDISCNWTGCGCGSLDVRFDKDELWLRAAPCRAGRASNSRVGATFACLRRCTDAAQLADGSGRAAGAMSAWEVLPRRVLLVQALCQAPVW